MVVLLPFLRRCSYRIHDDVCVVSNLAVPANGDEAGDDVPVPIGGTKGCVKSSIFEDVDERNNLLIKDDHARVDEDGVGADVVGAVVGAEIRALPDLPIPALFCTLVSLAMAMPLLLAEPAPVPVLIPISIPMAFTVPVPVLILVLIPVPMLILMLMPMPMPMLIPIPPFIFIPVIIIIPMPLFIPPLAGNEDVGGTITGGTVVPLIAGAAVGGTTSVGSNASISTD